MTETNEQTKEELLKKLGTKSKDDLISTLGSKLTKEELTAVISSKLKKDELASIADAQGDETKDQLVRKLASRAKDELVSALGSKVTKDDLVSLLGSRLKKDELAEMTGSQDTTSDEVARNETSERKPEPERDESTDLDWSAELDWSPPPAPTPAPVRFSGAAPYMPGQRVRVDISGLPMMGVFAGRGASAAGTITGVDARAREVTVYLDAVMDGKKEIVLPPERVMPEG